MRIWRVARRVWGGETGGMAVSKNERTPTTTELGILDLLTLRGFDPKCKAKLVRHQDKRFDIRALVRDGWIQEYQSLQARSIFGKCDFIVTFIGDGGTRAELLGVYRVINERSSTPEDVSENSPFSEWRDTEQFFYELEHQDQFANLERRVVIEWGRGVLSWHQHMRNKPIIEVYPPGRVLQRFSDYLDFSLTFQELQDLFNNSAAHRDWYSSLRAVAGVYLVLDSSTGAQYVGSACGLDGIWGRWRDYAQEGHGNNRQLRALVVDNPDACPAGFRFSLLQVLPKTTANSEVIRVENVFKAKLGSRVTGLNLN